MEKRIAAILLVFCAWSIILSACTAEEPPPTIESIAYGYFCELLAIPRASGDERKVSNYLVEFAETHGLEATQDMLLNVLIRKPGTEGREDEPPVVLQAHMDMVYEKNEGVTHHYASDPIIPIVDGDWVAADGTTLGADGGAGLAIIMAVLAADNLSHPPLEALITTAEETGMTGASFFKTSQLEGKRLINVDSEDDKALTVGCAGGAVSYIVVSVEYEPLPQGSVAYELKVKGLTGGHSATDIDKGRANANVLMGRLFSALDHGTVQVASIDGGSVTNAIPRECSAVIAFDPSELDSIASIIKQMQARFEAEYLSDSGLLLELEKTADLPEAVMTRASLQKVAAAIASTPNGVLKMNPEPEGLLQTSNNIGIVRTENHRNMGEIVVLQNFARSSSVSDLDDLMAELTQLAEELDIYEEHAKTYPVWEAKANSPLRKCMTAVYEEITGAPPIITTVHGGLECACFSEKMPDCDLISIGPTIEGAHSPEERMSIPSFNRTLRYLIRVLENL